MEELRKLTGSDEIVYEKLNLASLKSVRSFAENVLRKENKIHILINNAGTTPMYRNLYLFMSLHDRTQSGPWCVRIYFPHIKSIDTQKEILSHQLEYF